MAVSVEKVVEHANTMGRPAMRLLGVLICTVIGIAICAAFINWGFFHQSIPPIPLDNLLLAAVPYAYQGWDNWVRQNGMNKTAQYTSPLIAQVNPHGGPGAP